MQLNTTKDNVSTVMRLRSSIPITSLRAGIIDFEDFKRRCLLSAAVISDAKLLMDTTINTVNPTVSICLNARDLLAVYLFAFYDFDDSLKKCSLEVIDHLHDYNISTPLFWSQLLLLLKAYEATYLEWKPRDRISMLTDMCKMYWEYELVFKLNEPKMTLDERTHYATETSARQTKLLQMMHNIDDMRTFAAFETPVVFKEVAVNKIKNTLKRAFWDLIISDISQSPAQLTRLLSVFADIRSKLVSILKEGHDILEEFDDVMDPSFISQLHTTPATSQDTFWTSRCDFLISILTRLDSIKMFNVHYKWWSDLSKSREGHGKCVLCLAYFMDHLDGFVAIIDELKIKTKVT
jgi:hypothetical protein